MEVKKSTYLYTKGALITIELLHSLPFYWQMGLYGIRCALWMCSNTTTSDCTFHNPRNTKEYKGFRREFKWYLNSLTKQHDNGI